MVLVGAAPPCFTHRKSLSLQRCVGDGNSAHSTATPWLSVCPVTPNPGVPPTTPMGARPCADSRGAVRRTRLILHLVPHRTHTPTRSGPLDLLRATSTWHQGPNRWSLVPGDGPRASRVAGAASRRRSGPSFAGVGRTACPPPMGQPLWGVCPSERWARTERKRSAPFATGARRSRAEHSSLRTVPTLPHATANRCCAMRQRLHG